MTDGDEASLLPAIASAGPGVRLAVCYDGCWFRNAARYFARTRGAELSVTGLHDALRWHAAHVFGVPAAKVAICQAHYVTGRDPAAGPAQWDQVLADHGIIRHDVPVTAGKGEVGADVEFALTAYQIACEASPDMMVLLAGDGDFAPLAARLVGRGLRVLVPRANFSYPAGPDAQAVVAVTTSALLTRRATDTPTLADLIDAAMEPGYPRFLARPLKAARPDAALPAAPAARLQGKVTTWRPGSQYGFLTGGGLTWYASASEIPGHDPLAPGTLVTFTGDPHPPPGKPWPPARAILPHPPATPDPPPGTEPPANGTTDASRTHQWLTTVDSAALTQLREQASWTKGELARRSGVSITTITRLEQGDQNCHIRTVSRVATALGQPPGAITGPQATPPGTTPPDGHKPESANSRAKEKKT